MIFDVIDKIEMWRLKEVFDDISDYELIKVSEYLINNIRSDHDMPGKIWDQFLGIMDWYTDNQFITSKQRYWLMANLNQYLSQRDFMREFV